MTDFNNAGLFSTQQDTVGKAATFAFETQDNVRRFYRLLRDWSVRLKPWDTAIRYQTVPDERWDMTLVSQRVYGRRDEFMTVLACANLDTVEQELTERLLALPDETTLQALKQEAGYVSRAAFRG